MTKPAIKVEGLSKEYIVGHTHQAHTTFYDLLSTALKSPLRAILGQTTKDDKFWALRDVNFEVQPGEVVGIIGRNGAGKSTLLKILSRITAPTKGRVEVCGRLASLLEVGTGFHPELSGRENIYLNGAILGMTRTEITRKFDAIVAFAEVEKFIDTPVKRYSSGMYVRLAFAVAAHLDADVLLVDEVLAVGDAEFQKKCLGMMSDVAREGRTVLFVSHNMTALRNLCSSGILLANGEVAASGEVGDVLRQYTGGSTASGTAVEIVHARDDGKSAQIKRVSVEANTDGGDGTISVNTPFTIKIVIDLRQPNADIGAFICCYDKDRNPVFSSGSFFDKYLNGIRLHIGMHEFACGVPAHLLNDGTYTLDVMLISDRKDVIATEYSVLEFDIHDAPTDIEGWHWRPVGMIRPKLAWKHWELMNET